MSATVHVSSRDGALLARITPFDQTIADVIRQQGGRWEKPAHGYLIPPDRWRLSRIRSMLQITPSVVYGFDVDVAGWLDGLRPLGADLKKAAEDAARLRPTEAAIAELTERLHRVLPQGNEPMPFQVGGVGFIEACKCRNLLTDQPGLGKTIQALCWLALHPEVTPVLIVAPSIAGVNWVREACKWLPRRRVHQLRHAKDALPGDLDLLVMSYDILIRVKKRIAKLPWRCLIVDEAHRCANFMAQRTKAVSSLASKVPHFLPLTGTPIINRPMDMHVTLRLLRPDLFPGRHDFGLRYCNGHQKKIPYRLKPSAVAAQPREVDLITGVEAEAPKVGFREVWDYSGSSNVTELRALLATCMIRRLKSDVLTELPDKRYVVLPVDIRDDPEYAKVEAETAETLDGVSSGAALVRLGKLRHLTGMLKVPAALDWMEDFVQSGASLLVFCHHQDVGDALEAGLKALNVRTCRVDGRVTGDRRQGAVDAFQGRFVQVMIASIRAAGEALTLTAASDVLFVERDWTAAAEEQAADRVHRKGQTENVTVWFLQTQMPGTKTVTMDEDMHEAIEAKRNVSVDVLDPDMLRRSEDATAMSVAARILARHRNVDRILARVDELL